ncbi:CueP family metal-binding protein [Paenibacillus sp. GCM10012306]|uniref:CueP family metal-binding protein n=1 Tax=Paenibacillus sp. GCM10012306 TaxID=3317342 RepID=UPI00360B9CA2
MRWKTLAAAGVVVIALGTYLLVNNNGNKGNNEPVNIKQMVQDFSTRKATATSASITSKQLIVTGENAKEVAYDLPDNEFFLSIAPYIDQTHPCAIHSLTGCQGELANQEFSVTINDSEGKSVMDKVVMKSQANGFIDLWLPRDDKYQITVEREGKTAKSEISTYENDNTCVTTLQLS